MGAMGAMPPYISNYEGSAPVQNKQLVHVTEFLLQMHINYALCKGGGTATRNVALILKNHLPPPMR